MTPVYLTRDAILALDDVQIEELHVPQWGGTVRVRGMSGTQRDAFEKAISREKRSGSSKRSGKTTTEIIREQLRARLVAWCVVDDSGQRVFTDDDLPGLNAKSGAALEPIVDAAMRLSGMGDDDVDDLAQEMLEGENPSSASS